MIPKECRDLLELRKDMANKTESTALAQSNIQKCIGMLDYALTRGDINPVEHGNEMAWIDLLIATRENAART